MATNHLFSIQQHLSRQALGRVRAYGKSASNRQSAARRAHFKNILSAVQGPATAGKFKTCGLTIADYRARAVISKPRFRSQPTTNSLENRILTQTPARPPVATPKRIAPSAAGYRNENFELAKNPTPKIRQTPPALSEREVIEKCVQKAAAKYSLPPGLIKAVIRAESNFQVGAVSRTGARGLMQLMPATAKELGVADSFDIDQNIDGGAKYLRCMLDRFGGNLRKALAAYNAGPGTVIKYNGRVPYPETQQYIKRVLRFSKQMA
ncbi:MAG: lytic transglycosylase domain-containing protein [Desulfobacterales bacterium]|nr:lytic transglycosylase domain-containing protein [Desulfobacterales bacterium]